MDQRQHLLAEDDGGTNQAGGADVRQALPVAQVPVLGDTLGQNGFAALQNFPADELGHAAIRLDLGIAMPVGQHFQLAPLLDRQDGAHVGGGRLQQAVEHDIHQLLKIAGRPHVQRQAIQERQVAAQLLRLPGHGRLLVAAYGRQRRQETRMPLALLDGHALGVGLVHRHIG